MTQDKRGQRGRHVPRLFLKTTSLHDSVTWNFNVNFLVTSLISLTAFASRILHNVIVSSFPADLITKMSYAPRMLVVFSRATSIRIYSCVFNQWIHDKLQDLAQNHYRLWIFYFDEIYTVRRAGKLSTRNSNELRITLCRLPFLILTHLILAHHFNKENSVQMNVKGYQFQFLFPARKNRKNKNRYERKRHSTLI